MSIIPDDKIQEVRERASILDIVSEYVNLRKSGANYQGLCPFHGEKSPSFNVNPGRGIFHCFGCGVGGNVVTFIMQIEGLVFPEAVKLLAKRVGVVIEDRPQTKAEQKRQDEREIFYRITKLAAEYYRSILLESKEGASGRRYLERRGVTPETSEAYQLGFAPDKWDGLARYLERKREPLLQAEKLGLIRKRETGGYYDSFRNRLLFTINDSQGSPIGFGGRVVDDSLPKYINSPESPIYHKGDVLFGLDLARQSIREQGTTIIVEGYFDHLALYQAGASNVLATCGTALTPGHIKLLRRYAGKVYILFDSDSAGHKATCRAMELLLGETLPASVIELPTGYDPDSFISKAGQAAFSARLTAARPIFDWFFRDLLLRTETSKVEGKVQIIEELAPSLRKISNPVERELYVREIARILEVEERTLIRKLGRTDSSRVELSKPFKPKKDGIGKAEMLLMLMGKYPEVTRLVHEHGAPRLFPPNLLHIAEAILAQAKAGKELNLPLVLDQAGSDEERSRLAALFVNDAHIEEIDARKAFEQCRQALEREPLKEMKALAQELAPLDHDSPRYIEILVRIDNLRNKKSQLL